MTSSTETRSRRRPYPFLEWGAAAALLLLCAAYMSVGASGIRFGALFSHADGGPGVAATILFYVRLPRLIACVLVGAALSCAGLLLQAVLNNALASPGIIGINSGAGLAVVVTAVFAAGSATARTCGAFFGAFGAAMLVYGIARGTGAARGAIVLAGVAISTLFSALTDAVGTLFPETITDRAAFALGSFHAVSVNTLSIAGPVILAALIAAWLLANRVDILILGDDLALSLGVNARACRFAVLLVASLLAAGAVSIAGLLGFLGLIVPHIARAVVGSASHRRLVVLTALLGALLTLCCDLLARTLFIPYELPVGIPLSVLGVPFFLYLLLGKGRRRRYDTN